MKRLICCLLSVVVILSVCSIAFADDSVPDSSSGTDLSENNIDLPSSLLPVVIDDDTVRESDLMLRQFSVSLAQALATPTGNETAADIYALLYSAFINNPGGTSSFSVTDSSAIAWLQNIAYYLGYNNNSNQASPLYYTLLSGNELSISELMYVLVSQMLNLMDLSATDSSNNPIPLVQLFVQLANDVTGLSTNNTTQLNTIVSIASKLTDSYGSTIANRVYDIWAYMRDTIHGYDFYYTISALNDIKTSSQQLVANTNTVINSLSSSGAIASAVSLLNNDFNNINWQNIEVNDAVFYLNDLNTPITFDTSEMTYTKTNSLIASFRNNYFRLNTNNIYKIDLRLRAGSSLYSDSFIKSLTLKVGNQDISSEYYLFYNLEYSYISILFFDLNVPRTNNLNIYITFNDSWILRNQYSLDYINDSQIDYYTLTGFYIKKSDSNILKKLELLYASDDLIAAKQDQKEFEDEALGSFIGSGSQSPTLSDLGSVKDLSSGVTEGLDTGVGVSSALGVLTPDNNDMAEGGIVDSKGLFHWFTQDNADMINNYVRYQYIPTRSSGDNILPDIFSGSILDRLNNPEGRND